MFLSINWYFDGKKLTNLTMNLFLKKQTNKQTKKKKEEKTRYVP